MLRGAVDGCKGSQEAHVALSEAETVVQDTIVLRVVSEIMTAAVAAKTGPQLRSMLEKGAQTKLRAHRLTKERLGSVAQRIYLGGLNMELPS